MYAESDKDGNVILQKLSWYESRLILSALKLFLPSAGNTHSAEKIKTIINQIENII